MTFQGLDRKAVELLRALPSLDATAYAAHRDLLTEGLIKPGGELIAVLARRLEAGSVVVRSAVSPLHTDLRFAPAGAPRYKDHLLLTAWHGPDKKTAVMFWLRLDPESVAFAVGVSSFTPDMRDRWRRAVAGEDGQVLASALETLAEQHRDHNFEIHSDVLKRPPTPWDEHHPRAELLRRTGFQLRFCEPLPWELVEHPEFLVWCSHRLEGLSPVFRWLVKHVTGGRPPTLPVGAR